MNARHLALFASLGLLVPAVAQATRPAARSGYSIQLEDEHGNRLNSWSHRGGNYVLGNHGQRYNVRVYNHTGKRVEAVVTVDGRDAISGGVGDYKRQRGYIVQPYGSLLVEGFRKSHSSVASFRFTTPGDSYAGRMGTAHHTGVVGVAIFREKHRRPVAMAPKPRMRREAHADNFGGLGSGSMDRDSSPAPSAEAAPSRRKSARGHGSRPRTPRQNLGTQYGESRHSPVVEVAFRRARPRHPAAVLAVYYDDANGLAFRGVPVYPHYSGTPTPSPFPARFAPPPPRW